MEKESQKEVMTVCICMQGLLHLKINFRNNDNYLPFSLPTYRTKNNSANEYNVKTTAIIIYSFDIVAKSMPSFHSCIISFREYGIIFCLEVVTKLSNFFPAKYINALLILM